MQDGENAAVERAEKARKASDRAADGAKAMAEYQADKRAVEANTVRLRALRLEKERADQQVAEPAPAKTPSRRARAKVPA